MNSLLFALALGAQAPAPAAAAPAAAAPPAADAGAADAPPADAAPAAAAAAPPEETAIIEVPDSVFEDGVKLYETADYRGAAEHFWHYIKGNEQTADHYEWAEFYLAKSFLSLGLTDAAVEYLYNVAKERKRPERCV